VDPLLDSPTWAMIPPPPVIATGLPRLGSGARTCGCRPDAFTDTGRSVPMPSWIRDGPCCRNRTVLSESDRILCVVGKGCAALSMKNHTESWHGRHDSMIPVEPRPGQSLSYPEAFYRPPRRSSHCPRISRSLHLPRKGCALFRVFGDRNGDFPFA